MSLNEKQRNAMDAIIKGENIFITGGGGVGKTYFINQLKTVFRDKNISYTGTTGIASLLIQGTTIHSWSGIGISEFESVDNLVSTDKQFKKYMEDIHKKLSL